MTQVETRLTSPDQVGMSADRLERIAPALQKYVDERGYPGFTALVARRGQLVHATRVGYQDREAGVPVAEDTIYRFYSMTKPIICTALMTLFEEGRFQLTDPVAKWIPAFAATKIAGPGGTLEEQSPLRPMQVRDVMSHTSGLTYDFLDDFPVAEQYRAKQLMHDPTRTLEKLVDELATIPLAFAPGTRWAYSLGTDVTARLVEVISGQSLGDFLQERLFGPLGMTDTAFGVPESERHRISAMYGLPDLFAENMSFGTLAAAFAAGDIGRRDVDPTYPSDAADVFQRGGIGLFGTATDYLRFANMLLTGTAPDGTRIIGRKTLELMHTNHLAPALLPYATGGAPTLGYGFGLGSRVAMDIGQSGQAGSPGEFGWAGAAKTYYWVDPVEEVVGVLMTQYMIGFDLPEQDFRAVVYSSIED
ncbi:serine hydrolase domain-containing protein [Nakamurella leprariae]|uniref:Beta-lactamase family protein n=1 Tax=Nakamurella leprariae TaxID=2803911 RepID=A0A938YCT5_9ACTN|nr:serine hydrolase domain-containing protein [Nakamurella leprariae]MBM9466102.1 beta-lactamase family protein [Nakamurella leprariae]